MVDTPGFGDAIDNKNAFDPIIEYIDNQFEVRRLCCQELSIIITALNVKTQKDFLKK